MTGHSHRVFTLPVLAVSVLLAPSAAAFIPVYPKVDEGRPGLPERYQGHYLPSQTWEALVSDEPGDGLVRLRYEEDELTFHSRRVSWKTGLCSSKAVLSLLSQQDNSVTMEVEENQYCVKMEGPTTTSEKQSELRFWIEDGVAMTTGPQSEAASLVRLEDVAPGLSPQAVWSRINSWTASTFSRGWVQQNGAKRGMVWRAVYNLEAKGFELVRGDEHTPFSISIDDNISQNEDIWMYLGKEREVWLVSPGLPGIEFALERKSSAYITAKSEGEGWLTFKSLSSAPFIVLADVLNLRKAPDLKAANIGTLPHGSPVQVWARTGRPIKVGPVTGEWILVKHKSQIGWAFSPYVGERIKPSEPGDQAVHVIPTLTEGAPIAASTKGLEGHCTVDGVSQHVLREFGLVSAHVMLARLNEDGLLDPSCIFKTADAAFVCPVLSSGASSGWQSTNCIKWDEPELPGISGKDINGDGVRDLILRGESTQSFPFGVEEHRYKVPEASP